MGKSGALSSSAKKTGLSPAIMGVIIVLVVLVGLYLLAKAVFWVALAVVAIIGAVYLYKLANKKEAQKPNPVS